MYHEKEHSQSDQDAWDQQTSPKEKILKKEKDKKRRGHTSGMCLETAYIPSKFQIAFAAFG